MIARIWKGETPESKADQYFNFMKEYIYLHEIEETQTIGE